MSEAYKTDPSRGSLPGVPSLPAARATLAQAARAADTMEDPSGQIAVRAAIAGLHHRAGDGPGAARMMALVLDGARELPEPAVRAAALGGIAQAQAETGECQGAQATIAEAVAAAPAAGDEAARALGAIAEARAAAGDVAGGLATAQAIGKGRERDGTRTAIAFIAQAGRRFREALSACRAIEDCDLRTPCLWSLARAQVAARDAVGAARSLADALASVRGVANEADRVEMLVEIWKVQFAGGFTAGAGRTMEEALALARAIGDVDDQVCVLAYIARNQGGRGERAAALRTVASVLGVARGIADGRARASALCSIAMAQVQSGDRAAALRSVAAAEDAAGADPHDLAVAQAFTGDDRAARATVHRVAGPSERDEALAEISGIQCRANRVAEAVATTRGMASPGARCGALVRIGDVLVRDGDCGRAAEPLALAEEAAGAIGEGTERARALVRVARLQLDCAVGRGRVAG